MLSLVKSMELVFFGFFLNNSKKEDGVRTRFFLTPYIRRNYIQIFFLQIRTGHKLMLRVEFGLQQRFSYIFVM